MLRRADQEQEQQRPHWDPPSKSFWFICLVISFISRIFWYPFSDASLRLEFGQCWGLWEETGKRVVFEPATPTYLWLYSSNERLSFAGMEHVARCVNASVFLNSLVAHFQWEPRLAC